MNRRAFLALVSAGLAGHALDIDRLLWVPGQRTIFLPSIVPPLQFHPDAFNLVMDPLIMEAQCRYNATMSAWV